MSEVASKTSWARVAFGDVVRLCKERSSDPGNDGFERYVGLEHIDPGDLKIRRWGSVSDGITFSNVFRAGQVLFGKRRAYQRKVAVADFDGVCSGDIYVLEPKGEDLLPALLGFICQTDRFFEHAVGTSAGSLSPRTNWKSLSNYEFAMPPLEEQRRVAEILEAAREVSEALARALECQCLLVRSMLGELFTESAHSMPLSDWCRELITYGIVQAGANTPGGVPYIRVSDMTAGATLVVQGMLRTTPEIAARYRRSEVSGGDIVVALRGPVGLVRIVPQDLDGANLTQGTARVAVKEGHSRDYVFWALQAPETQRQYCRYAKGSTFSEISLGALRQIEIPMISEEAQHRSATQLNELESARSALKKRFETSSKWMKTGIESLLRGGE